MNYREQKQKIEKILEENVVISDEIEKIDEFSYKWTTTIAMSILNLDESFKNKEKIKIYKILSSEILDLLKDSVLDKEIGILGESLYVKYFTPLKKNIYEIFNQSILLNTYMIMLNDILEKKWNKEIKIGIGIASAKEIMIKENRENNLSFENSIPKALGLSKINKFGDKNIRCLNVTYINMVDEFIKKNGEDSEGWFRLRHDSINARYYDANIFKNKIKELK